MQQWMMRPQDFKNNPKLAQTLTDLLPLKKKFPKILDPSQGRKLYKGKSLYRGTLLPMKDLVNLKGSWRFSTSVFPTGAISTNTPYTWNAVGSSEKGFTSFTPSSNVANNFAASIASQNGVMQSDRDYDRFVEKLSNEDYMGMVPVVLEIPDTHPTAIMNPEFTVALSNWFSEYEVYVLGNDIAISSINVFDWEYYERAFKRANTDPVNYFVGL
jgi:hypothetical protein